MSAEETKVYSDGYERVFAETQNALIECNFKIKASDISTGQIMASASMSLMS